MCGGVAKPTQTGIDICIFNKSGKKKNTLRAETLLGKPCTINTITLKKYITKI
jgi:hypothetical protein